MSALVDLDALEAAARAATPGPWAAPRIADQPTVRLSRPHLAPPSEHNAPVAVMATGHRGASWADADFVAAANPAAVLELVRRVRAAEASAADAYAREDKRRTSDAADWAAIRAELDAAKRRAVALSRAVAALEGEQPPQSESTMRKLVAAIEDDEVAAAEGERDIARALAAGEVAMADVRGRLSRAILQCDIVVHGDCDEAQMRALMAIFPGRTIMKRRCGH